MLRYDYLEEMIVAVEKGEIPEIVLKAFMVVYKSDDDLLEKQAGEDQMSYAKYVALIYHKGNEENAFSWRYGGKANICETEEDLKEIEGCDMEWAAEHDDKWPNVTDKPMSWDVCEYALQDRNSGWGVFLMCWNNAGGNIYYVPERLWSACQFDLHVIETNGM